MRERERYRDREKERQRQRDKQTERESERQRERQTERETDRQTEREREAELINHSPFKPKVEASVPGYFSLSEKTLKQWSRPNMTLAVDGTLNTSNQIEQCYSL